MFHRADETPFIMVLEAQYRGIREQTPLPKAGWHSSRQDHRPLGGLSYVRGLR